MIAEGEGLRRAEARPGVSVESFAGMRGTISRVLPRTTGARFAVRVEWENGETSTVSNPGFTLRRLS